MSVADSQSNTVKLRAGPWHPVQEIESEKITKPLTLGESCVNTHTGSVGVAVPQSNIVKREVPCKVRPDASVGVVCKVQDSKSVNVGMPECGTVFKNIEVRDRWQRSTPGVLESGIQACGKLKVTKESMHFVPKPTFDLCNVTGGKFNLKKKSTYMKTKSKIQESDISVGRSTSNPNDEFRGEKFNGISIVSTPTKRKPEYSSQVSSLRLHFEGLPANNQGQCTDDMQYSESPAKRRKWGRGQGGVRSATPGD